MKNFSVAKSFLPLLAVLALTACSSDEDSIKQDPEHQTALQGNAETLYNNGIDALRSERYEQAIELFETLQQNFPYSGYVANAQLMEGYAYYLQGSYPDAVRILEKFLQLHPTSPDAAYAYYLRALCFYEQIPDVQRDQRITLDAMTALNEVVTRFPQTSYARDAQLKIDLCRDHLAGKEMLVGRYYAQQKVYGGALNRFQRVVLDFQTTNHVAEALYRLVEVNLHLGLTEQARKAASVLGYNYPGSPWYRYAYDVMKDNNLLSNKAPTPKAPEEDFFSHLWGEVF
ncbi:outer membrane protein assembly factor BamD [Entomobacter blattae]|uniref:outer membrane protein assembly factor BamD n=1 Tax=Entomobacter blattae TaxID=2762277 RepID=UPI00193B691D|nr:outer membrane protein assembly factor BamD [Entomobacter blattae]